MTRDEFEDEFGKDYSKDAFYTFLSGFDWSFQNEQEEIVFVGDYYEKQ